ncbi:MAG: hypothetical protein ABI904_15170 [Chloroflexota bacterium]
MLKNTIAISALLMVISAFGLLFFPAKMLSVVGIIGNPQTEFLLRVSGVGVASLIPGVWAVRTAAPSLLARAVLSGLAIYMFLSSAVDFLAYTQAIVNAASIPSITLRILIGCLITWSIIKEKPQK